MIINDTDSNNSVSIIQLLIKTTVQILNEHLSPTQKKTIKMKILYFQQKKKY